MLNFTKIVAALFIAGGTAMFSGILANQFVSPQNLSSDAVPIAGAAMAAAPAKKKGPEPILPLLASADIARGEKVAKACAACHTFDKGGKAKVGPNLWNIVNRPIGSVEGFSYSAGMASKGGEWTEAVLGEYLWKPKAYVKGTKMSYAGIKKVDDRAAVVAWLRTLADTPAPLPDDAAIAAEAEHLGQ